MSEYGMEVLSWMCLGAVVGYVLGRIECYLYKRLAHDDHS